MDIFEIVPKVSYTKDDLNYGDKDSRATREQYDENSRPVIKNKINDISKYDTIIIGHPIWWGEAPKIIRTFLESENFNGKIISTFVTSGSSDIGSSAEPLKSIVKGATWKDGRRFDNSNSEKEIKDWIRSLGL